MSAGTLKAQKYIQANMQYAVQDIISADIGWYAICTTLTHMILRLWRKNMTERAGQISLALGQDPHTQTRPLHSDNYVTQYMCTAFYHPHHLFFHLSPIT